MSTEVYFFLGERGSGGGHLPSPSSSSVSLGWQWKRLEEKVGRLWAKVTKAKEAKKTAQERAQTAEEKALVAEDKLEQLQQQLLDMTKSQPPPWLRLGNRMFCVIGLTPMEPDPEGRNFRFQANIS
ncbi:hypothetical protein Salat_2698300 [Sesamum alatum]|uniref:Uncharacterized protein n=1 Tax=Sesamum alatum TaxID=300844 RepID=A0AAE2CBB2_9LAMI|nr:hypothetical protein Salat_2698300 [Sesamum alatum]